MVEIISAAVEYQGLIFSAPRPMRHHHIVHAMYNMGLPKAAQRVQGFLTSDGRFVDRQEGVRIALAAGQVEPGKLHLPEKLLSEDLW